MFDLQKPVPNCMGSMINIFELTTAMAKTKLLTEKPHCEAIPPNPNQRNQPDVVKRKIMDKFGAAKDEKTTNKKSNLWRSLSKKSIGTPMKMLLAQEMLREIESRQSPPGVVAKLMGLDPLRDDTQLETKVCSHENEHRDVYEVGLQHSTHDENTGEERKELVHQKFTEAKRPSSDEVVLQSTEFEEALEVLSSNRDLFLKFLQVPNALLSNHIRRLQTISPDARHDTVLEPSKSIEPKGEADSRCIRPSVKDIDRNIFISRRSSRSSNFVYQWPENIFQSTRIVVLKPNPAISNEMKRMESKDLFGCTIGPDEENKSREVAKEMTREIAMNCKDEILSSASSNGYVADESSVDRSKREYIEEDCISRTGSPCSVSTLRRSSKSREPSVIKEAKRRLSERLAMVASTGSSPDQSQLRRSTSTLGEMLAFPEKTKDEGMVHTDRLAISSRKLYAREDSPRNLTRSKSVPVASSVFEHIGLREDASDSMIGKPIFSKSKSGMSNFKEKVSSFFSSKTKKAAREKPIPPNSEASSERNETSSVSFHHCYPEESVSDDSEGMTRKVSSFNGAKQGSSSLMSCLPFERSRASQSSRYSQDHQPCPISDLEPPLEDDANMNISAISNHPQALSRSPPIGSVSRTLTWEDPSEVPDSIKLSRVLSRKCEEQERSLLIQKLLSCANLLDVGDNETSTVLSRWHSLDSPLDPFLLNELLNQRQLFDCVNAAILSIGQTALMSIYPWAKPHVRVRRDGEICPQVAEEISRLVKDWFSREKNLFSGSVDELVKEEVGGRGWEKSACLEVGEFCGEISGKVLEDLVEDALTDLTDGCFL